MSRRLKIIAFAATLAGFAAMVGAYDLGFERWPPRTTLADGRSVPLYAAGVQACFKARALALLDDATADDNWQACRQRLMAYGALDAFKLRCVAVAGSAAIGLLGCSDSPSAFVPIVPPSRSRAAHGCTPARPG